MSDDEYSRRSIRRGRRAVYRKLDRDGIPIEKSKAVADCPAVKLKSSIELREQEPWENRTENNLQFVV